jgi:hypothetical protein
MKPPDMIPERSRGELGALRVFSVRLMGDLMPLRAKPTNVLEVLSVRDEALR